MYDIEIVTCTLKQKSSRGMLQTLCWHFSLFS